MAKWVRFQLNGGLAEGKRLISEKNFGEMHTPQMAMRPEDAGRNWNPLSVQHSYAMGWFLGEYRGYRLVNHGGAIDGFRTSVTLVPSEHLGIVVLANLDSANMPEALRWEIMDAVLGLPSRDWDTELIAHFGQIERDGRARTERFRNSRIAGTKPSLEAPGYTGRYENPGYGDILLYAPRAGLCWLLGEAPKLRS